jgi:CRISPR/Cas system-associated exonuclease Cas4 (RecB family)
MATLKKSKPYIWVSWLAKYLAEPKCQYSWWFRVHYQYDKCEEMGPQLAEWNREHTAMMNERRAELEEAGFVVRMESDNEFKIEGKFATIAGKPDITAAMIGTVRYTYVIDGKTGIERDSDQWQVRIYLYALPRARKDLIAGSLEGEVHYKVGDRRVKVMLSQRDEKKIIEGILRLSHPTPPAKVPSRDECKFCNIGIADCPERVMPAAVAQTQDF